MPACRISRVAKALRPRAATSALSPSTEALVQRRVISAPTEPRPLFPVSHRLEMASRWTTWAGRWPPLALRNMAVDGPRGHPICARANGPAPSPSWSSSSSSKPRDTRMVKHNFKTSSAPKKLSVCCSRISTGNEPYKEFMAFLFIPKMGRDLIATQREEVCSGFSAANRLAWPADSV